MNPHTPPPVQRETSWSAPARAITSKRIVVAVAIVFTCAVVALASAAMAYRQGVNTAIGTVTLFGMCCSRGVFGHAYLNRVGAVCG